MPEETVKANVEFKDSGSVKLSVLSVDEESTVTVRYETLNGNKPKENGNYLGIWKSDRGNIPGGPQGQGEKALFSTKLDSNSQSSQFTIINAPIDADEYVMGYCQTGDPQTSLDAAKNVSASAVISSTFRGANATNFMTLNVTGNSSAPILEYKILKNTDYSSHWFGIWKANQTVGADAPIYAASVKDSDGSKNGKISIKKDGINRGNYYLAYFANGWNEENDKRNTANMAAFIEFMLE